MADNIVGTSTPETEREASGKKRMSKKERKESKKLRKISATSVSAASTPDSDHLASYIPIEVPTQPSKEVSETSNPQKQKRDFNDEGGEGNSSATLGKWFPNALLLKCPVNYTNTGQLLLNSSTLTKEDIQMENPLASLVLFYQYSAAAAGKQWSPNQVKLLMTYLSTVARRRNIGGRIRVATEGVNATISAVDMPNLSAREALRHFAQDLKNFDPAVFSSADFKYIDDLPADRHFKELRIIPVQELVFYDIRENEAPLQPGLQNNAGPTGGIHLDAKEYHQMLKKENTVVVDVRNHYETIIGRFDGQESVGGANYIDPKMRKSTDFKGWLAKDETKKKLKDKTVLMFCTGGIRCERASAYLKNKLGSEVQEVYQVSPATSVLRLLSANLSRQAAVWRRELDAPVQTFPNAP
jgi:predicted sulfurtransferase